MVPTKLRRWLMVGAAPCVALTLSLPAASAAAAATTKSVKTTAATLPAARGARQKMIVIFKDQYKGLHSIGAKARAERATQSPVVSSLKAAGARDVTSLSIVNAVSASLTKAQAAALRHDSAVASVVPNGTITGPSVPVVLPGRAVLRHASRITASTGGTSTSFCSTTSKTAPELDPQALKRIDALPEVNGSATVPGTTTAVDGAGVSVAYMADGVDTSIADFQRNAAYASSSSAQGSPVIKQVDFSSDGPNAPTAGGEAFLDASSIAAQGNTAYDLNAIYNSVPTSPDCWIKIVGAAPGASVIGLKVFAQTNVTTNSAFVQAIQYAVQSGVKVLNESFGANEMPESTADLIKVADNAAVAAGVTVVVSSGDAGANSTQGSPATDPNVIDVGASTTFRAYEQNTFGGAGWPGASGGYTNNNISSLSSGGYSQLNASTVDLVAPGDLNWAECSTAMTGTTPTYADCGSPPAPIQLSGGTSESAPLTAAAAADVIQAYAATHAGTDPTPAMVKQILMSTATDISAPADQQGAGLLNVNAAVTQAEAMPGNTTSSSGGVVVTSANQINVSQNPGATSAQTVTLENTSSSSQTVSLSTRALSTTPNSTDGGSFCMQPSPSNATAACPANTGTMKIWSGATEVYENQTFTVPSSGASRLVFRADYPNTGQSSVVHVALFDPSGNLVGYSLPQGLGDYAQVEVSSPVSGTWTAVFFTLDQDTVSNGATGTQGIVSWQATTYSYQSGDTISPSSLTIAAGQSASATLSVKSPSSAGDTSESVVASYGSPVQTLTIPVTVRTLVPSSGTFEGILYGGNGRAGSAAQENTYQFNVPAGEQNLDVYLHFADGANTVVSTLTNPYGQVVSTDANTGNALNAYHLSPSAGLWTLTLFWQNPMSGNELSQLFSGQIAYNQLSNTANLPDSTSTMLADGQANTYTVNVTNNGTATEQYFVDPRLSSQTTYSLVDLGSNSGGPSVLPSPNGTYIYSVPPFTSQIQAGLSSSTLPVSFDAGLYFGDPDYYATSACGPNNTAALTVNQTNGSGNAYGLWFMQPAECGPFAGPAGTTTVTPTFTATTRAFDPTVTSSTGDIWAALAGASGATTSSLTLAPGQSGAITVTITPNAPGGSVQSGTLYLATASPVEFGLTGDTLQAFPYSYTAIAPPGAPTGVTAKAGNASATVSWTAPSETGDSPITGYQVTATSSSGSSTTTTFDTTATTEQVTGLTNGTSYTFTVAAVNAAGTGPASNPSKAVTPKGPSRVGLGLSTHKVIFGSESTEHFSVTVAPSSAVGKVAVRTLAGRTLCAATLKAGKGRCTLGPRELRPGSYTIVAVYGGDRALLGSKSGRCKLTVARTLVGLGLSTHKVTFGSENTEHFSVIVRPLSAVGKVAVRTLAGRTLCTIALKGGKGRCTLGSRELRPGSYTIVAVYGGDRFLLGARSGPCRLVVRR